MSKMSELDLVLKELWKYGESLVGICEELAGIFSGLGETEIGAEKPTAGKRKETVKEHELEVKAEKQYSLTEVKAFLMEKFKAEHTVAVKGTLRKHGADKLYNIELSEYVALVAETECWGTAKHVNLSVSAKYRRMKCLLSAKLCAEQQEERVSPYARQSTDYHELWVYLVEKEFGRKTKDPMENLECYDQEMWDCAENYASYVMEQVEEAKKYCTDPQAIIKQRPYFFQWVENGFSIGDCEIVADDVFQIIDYKHGAGVLVYAEKNFQIMCYVWGVLELFDGIYGISEIGMTIYLIRRENVSTYSITKEELIAWVEAVRKFTAELDYEGKDDFKSGDHCQFCKMKMICQKRAEYNLELVWYDFEISPVLEDEELVVVLAKVDSGNMKVVDFACREKILDGIIRNILRFIA